MRQTSSPLCRHLPWRTFTEERHAALFAPIWRRRTPGSDRARPATKLWLPSSDARARKERRHAIVIFRTDLRRNSGFRRTWDGVGGRHPRPRRANGRLQNTGRAPHMPVPRTNRRGPRIRRWVLHTLGADVPTSEVVGCPGRISAARTPRCSINQGLVVVVAA